MKFSIMTGNVPSPPVVYGAVEEDSIFVNLWMKTLRCDQLKAVEQYIRDV